MQHGRSREARQEAAHASTLELADLEKLRTKYESEQRKLARAGEPNTLGTCWYCGDRCGASGTLCGACMGNKTRRKEMYEQRLKAEAAAAEASPDPEQQRTNERGEPMEEGWRISEYEARRLDPGYRDPRYD